MDLKRLVYLLFLAFFFSQPCFAKAPEEIQVCSQCEFKSIQKAIEAIAPGGSVFVGPGTYLEGKIQIAKSLKLIGKEGPILDGQGQFQILQVHKADQVEISGLTFKDTGISYTEDLSGVRITESKQCSIHHNKFINTTYGVYLENSEACHVFENEFLGQAATESSAGNGVHIWYGSSHLIEKNKVSGHRDGIYLEFANLSEIRRNEVKKNIRYGLHLMSSNQSVYENNSFSENEAGVAVMYSRKIRMVGNRFVNNTGPAAYGLLLKEVIDSEISQNELRRNTVGIFMEGSNRSRFHNNQLSDNGWALRIMGDCENNDFTANNFLYNSFDVTTNADHSWNTFNGNHWSQYDGYDLDRDGQGDKPYQAVSLSSVILERIDSSYILMNSFFFQILDQVEKALPTLIPEPLKDESPLMKPVPFAIPAKEVKA